MRLGREREAQGGRNHILLEGGVRGDVLDRAAFVDDHLHQLIHDIGGASHWASTQQALLARESQPTVVVADTPGTTAPSWTMR